LSDFFGSLEKFCSFKTGIPGGLATSLVRSYMQFIPPLGRAYIYAAVGLNVSVCMSVCLSVCLSGTRCIVT